MTDTPGLPQEPIVPWEGVPPSGGRRVLDVAGACAALLLLAAPMLVIYLLVRLTSHGPGLFRQVRLGQGGRPFRFYKFRTMRTGVGGLKVTANGDPRLTRIGKVLRKLSLDELPQFWNVLRGDMTLVGPRPETPDLAVHYPPDLRWVFDFRPGLTGPSEVRFRDMDVLGPGEEVDLRVYIERIVPARVAVDASYLCRPSMGATLMAVFDTVRHLLGLEVAPLSGTRTAARAGERTTARADGQKAAARAGGKEAAPAGRPQSPPAEPAVTPAPESNPTG
jgi:lipopolysaccharide/colanic/teichoic acid biosynthesis glycosyltransferase